MSDARRGFEVNPVGHDGPSFALVIEGEGYRAVLLTADVGNTEIVLGVFEGDDLRHTWRLSTRPERTSDELASAARRVPRPS